MLISVNVWNKLASFSLWKCVYSEQDMAIMALLFIIYISLFG